MDSEQNYVAPNSEEGVDDDDDAASVDGGGGNRAHSRVRQELNDLTREKCSRILNQAYGAQPAPSDAPAAKTW